MNFVEREEEGSSWVVMIVYAWIDSLLIGLPDSCSFLFSMRWEDVGRVWVEFSGVHLIVARISFENVYYIPVYNSILFALRLR